MHRLPPIAVILCIIASLSLTAHARNFRVSRIPNGAVASCSNCHVNPAGGGTRTAFGAAVNTAIGGVSTDVAFWTAAFAALDSDGDGRTNGVELRDPDGDLIPIDAIGVTNPGNRPPTFTNSPAQSATMGIAYASTVTASDAEANAFTFAKVTGPAWLAVSSAGAISGTPPAGSAGSQSVSISVTDTGTTTKGFSRGSNTLTYTLSLISSYAGWQNLNFTLPAEAALAGPLIDADSDGLANVLEYAVRLPVRTSSPHQIFAPGTDLAGHLGAVINVRDDDPKLSLVMEAADDLSFSSVTTIEPVVTDPIPGDGLKQYFFIDTVPPNPATARFVRLRVRLAP